MDQIKNWKIYSWNGKKNNLTQIQLAEKLNNTEWRLYLNGKMEKQYWFIISMLDLCNELKISVNELLSGRWLIWIV